MSASGLLGVSDRRWHKLSRGKLIRRALYVILLIGIPDYLLGGRNSLALLYVLPIGVVAWYVGRRWAWLLALISLTPTLLAAVQTGRLQQQPVLLIWQGVQHLGFLWLIIWLLDGLRRQSARATALVRLDELTGLFNRHAFLEQLQYRLDLAARTGRPITLISIGLNDPQAAGRWRRQAARTQALAPIAQALKNSIRRTDLIARTADDEFTLLMDGASSGSAEYLIARFRRAIDEAGVTLTCSMGCVTFQMPPADAESALIAAERLMQRVRREGNQAVTFSVFDSHANDFIHSATS